MDLRWSDDMQLDAAETDGDEEELEQDVLHVIEQDLASNPDDPTRGLGVANIASHALLQSSKSWEQKAVTEAQKDDRIDAVTAEMVVADDGSVSLDISIEVDGAVLDVTVPVPTQGAQTSS